MCQTLSKCFISFSPHYCPVEEIIVKFHKRGSCFAEGYSKSQKQKVYCISQYKVHGFP